MRRIEIEYSIGKIDINKMMQKFEIMDGVFSKATMVATIKSKDTKIDKSWLKRFTTDFTRMYEECGYDVRDVVIKEVHE